jgi:hypothetical protein
MAIATAVTLTPTPPNFSTFGPRISLYTPLTHTSGELVILCTWLGAARKYIDKYIAAYRTIAPNAKILLIESDITSITSPYSSQRKAVMPAVEIVGGVLSECTSTTKSGRKKKDGGKKGLKILLHTFSNGGLLSATALLLASHSVLPVPLPLIGTIMDSGPAAGYYWKSYNAMVLSLPKGMMRWAGYVVVHGILLGLFASVGLGRYEYPEILVRRTMLDEEYVCNARSGKEGETRDGADEGKKGRICYIYSKADQMTDWHDVVEHADRAREKGWEVEEWRLEDTAHCNHFRKYEEGYFGRMRAMWAGEALS